MKTQELISSVIDAQMEEIQLRPAGLTREVLGQIPVVERFATIITGIRRCGKSTLMLQILKNLKGRSLFLNFEDIRLSGFETSDFSRLNAEVEKRNANLLFFDEIQNIDQWEVYINQLLNAGCQVFITGSNASLMSRELGTHLTGRHLSSELFPFSYAEFLAFHGFKTSLKNFKDYLETGGMPEYVKKKRAEILQQLINDLLYRDIAVRHGIRNVEGLRELTVFLLSNIGKPVSARKLTGLFGITAASTITDYFSFLSDSYIVDFIPRFDYSLKSQNRNPKKIYAIDLGIFHQLKTTFTDDCGRQLENAVYLHLRRKYRDIYYYSDKGECDFVVMEKGKAISCLQVCAEIDDMNIERELNGLKAALKFFGLENGNIITYKQSDRFESDGLTIDLVPGWKYMAGGRGTGSD